MSGKSESTTGGIGLGGLLFVLFLGLKLCHVIDWDWVWVFAPLWVPIAIVFGAFVLILLFSWVFWIVVKAGDFLIWGTKGWWD